MSKSLIAKRYAKALLRLSGGQVEIAKKGLNELKQVKSLFDLDEAKQILQSPVMPNSLKNELVRYAASTGGANNEYVRFFEEMVAAGRTELIPATIDWYERLLDELDGKVRATVETAVEFKEAQLHELSSTISKVFNKKIESTHRINPKILGGLRITMGHKLIDMSLLHKVDQIANALES